VDARVAALFAVGGLLGSFAGARLAVFLSDSAQMLLFALVLLAAAFGMYRRAARSADAEPPTAARAAPRQVWFVPALGVGMGLLTGVMGVGGGFLIVPALNLLAGVSVKRAAATSLWIIAANSATGTLGYVGRVPVAWETAGLFLAVALVGMVAGQAIARAAQPRRLQAAFALFLILVGLFTLVESITPGPSRSSAPRPEDVVASRAEIRK